MAVLPSTSESSILSNALHPRMRQRAPTSTSTPTGPENEGAGLTHDEIIAIISALIGFVALVVATATLVYAYKTMRDAQYRSSENIWQKFQRWFGRSKR